MTAENVEGIRERKRKRKRERERERARRVGSCVWLSTFGIVDRG
jgi:hypothetical protein